MMGNVLRPHFSCIVVVYNYGCIVFTLFVVAYCSRDLIILCTERHYHQNTKYCDI